MKIVCFILLVTFCVYGRAEDPPKPAATPAAGAGAPAPAATAPAAPAPAATAPAAAAPVALAPGATAPAAPAPGAPGLGGFPAPAGLTQLASLAKPLTPPATDSGTSTGVIGGMNNAKDAWKTWSNTVQALGNTLFGSV